MESIKCVLLDIEGTICPISFVKDTLFPYALKALPSVLADKWNDQDFIQYRDAFPTEYRSSPEVLLAHVEDLTRRDVKIAYLKNLQGFLWETGYRTGAYSTPLFPDVVPQLRRWKDDDGMKLVIYSSGSIFAQKLLFGHVQVTTEGGDSKHAASAVASHATEDMTNVIDGWFDTTNAGLKAESNSYTHIAEAIKIEPSATLFFSDNVKEVEAAIVAGMKAVVVERPGNADLSDEDRARYRVVSSLDEAELAPAEAKSSASHNA